MCAQRGAEFVAAVVGVSGYSSIYVLEKYKKIIYKYDLKVLLQLLLAAGENRHSEPGKNRQKRSK